MKRATFILQRQDSWKCMLFSQVYVWEVLSVHTQIGCGIGVEEVLGTLVRDERYTFLILWSRKNLSIDQHMPVLCIIIVWKKKTHKNLGLYGSPKKSLALIQTFLAGGKSCLLLIEFFFSQITSSAHFLVSKVFYTYWSSGWCGKTTGNSIWHLLKGIV